uniref:Uncharacterized protein n=1 Tax=Peronospora matthiolae TaxID=2874970 RepID=A0AAV1UHD6_9STRA
MSHCSLFVCADSCNHRLLPVECRSGHECGLQQQPEMVSCRVISLFRATSAVNSLFHVFISWLCILTSNV